MRAILNPQGALWAAQCLDYDVAACGGSITEAKTNMLQLIEDQRVIDGDAGRWNLRGIPKAPEAFVKVWDGAQLMDSTAEMEWRLINMDTPGAATLMMDAFP